MADSPLMYDPATGAVKPYPANQSQYRLFHSKTVWTYNPWTGRQRCDKDIAGDPFGLRIPEGKVTQHEQDAPAERSCIPTGL